MGARGLNPEAGISCPDQSSEAAHERRTGVAGPATEIIHVLMVEDDGHDARVLIHSLKESGAGRFRVTRAARLREAVEALSRSAADVVLLDLSLPDSGGLETVGGIQAAAPDVPIVVLTGCDDEQLGLEAVRRGVQDYLVKGQCEAGLVARALRYAVERRRAEHALRDSEAKFRTLADGSPVLMWVTGPGGAEFVNRAYLDFLGLPDERALQGYDWVRFVHPEDREGYVGRYLECLARRGEFEAECRFRRRDGEYRRMRSAGRPRFSPAGDFLGYVGSTVDLTDAKQAEDVIRDGLARLCAVVDTAVDAIITIDQHGRIESVNPATERLFGYARDEMVGQSVKLLMPEPYRGEYERHLRHYLRTGEARVIGVGGEVVGLRKDGSTVPLNLSVSAFRLGGRRMFTGILHDVTERRRLERQILDISSAEQRRIGQDLHDGLCQELVGVAFAAKLLAGRLQSKLPGEAAGVRELAGLVDGAITQARALAHGLNPVELHGGDLAAALEALASKVSSLFHVVCECRCDEQVVLSDGSTATHLYRIAQEAVSNAVKHGKAGRIDIEVTSSDAWVTLAVTDDGRGIPAVLPETAGIGLSTMSYRARVIGGSFSVQPGPRGGTVVTCVIPRPEAQHLPARNAAGNGEAAAWKRGGGRSASSHSVEPAASAS